MQQLANASLSFGSARTLSSRVELLPDPGARWKMQEIIPIVGTPSKPVNVFYRDPIGLIKYLMGNPKFAPGAEYAPRKAWEVSDDGEIIGRRYSELWTGDWVWRTQVC